jgi:hypothetical protein
MGAMRKVLEWGMQRRGFVRVEENATEGAVVGKNVFNPDGTLWNSEEVITRIVSEVNSDSGSNSKYIAIWRFLREIPINIKNLAAMAGIGFAARISSAGEWANRTITGTVGRIEVESGDGVPVNEKWEMNSGDIWEMNSGGAWGLNALTEGNPIIQLGPWPTVQNSIESGLEYIIPLGHQLIVFDSFDVDGTLEVNGDLVIL